MVELQPHLSEDRNAEFSETPLSVLTVISQSATSKGPFLDLSRKGLNLVPPEMLTLSHIEYLYLEGNHLTEIPSDFFDYFPHLKWLDLRNNKLQSLPSVFIGRHSKLQTLLLHKNQIKSLPLELGHVTSLTGLHIGDNPLEFPPVEILAQGVYYILAFLREMMIAKTVPDSAHDFPQLASLSLQDGIAGPTIVSPSPSSSPTSPPPSRPYDLVPLEEKRGSVDSATAPPISQAAKLHKPVAYYQIRHQYLERVRTGPAGDQKSLKTQSSKHDKYVNRYPEPPSLDLIEGHMLEERRKKRIKEVNEKQDAILQRRKDQESVKQWRDESKRKQHQKYIEQLRKGPTQIHLESGERVREAPFGVRGEDLQIIGSEEHMRTKNVPIKPEDKPKPLSSEELAYLENQRRAREQVLEAQIREHTKDMQERKKNFKGTAKEEMEMAQRDLQIAEQLHKQLVQRKVALD